jgi:hypothetical protein
VAVQSEHQQPKVVRHMTWPGLGDVRVERRSSAASAAGATSRPGVRSRPLAVSPGQCPASPVRLSRLAACQPGPAPGRTFPDGGS